MRNKKSSLREERPYTYKNSGFADMRDRIAEKKKDTAKVYKVYPWKAYAAF